MMGPVFLDSSCFIYFIEGRTEFTQKLVPIFKQIENNTIHVFSSIISVSEVLVGPLKQNNQDLINRYHNLFTNYPSLEITSPSYKTALSAALMRVKYGFKLPDCYQLALAVESGCKSFYTNDAKLKKFPDMQIILLSPET